eukprot:3593452-Amphidinium_carterae.1
MAPAEISATVASGQRSFSPRCRNCRETETTRSKKYRRPNVSYFMHCTHASEAAVTIQVKVRDKDPFTKLASADTPAD